ncbi:MAG: carotenoid biosynthesis protein [Gemmatimonadota bacterium]
MTDSQPWSPWEQRSLLAFLGFTVVAVAGYGVFGVRPDRLPDSGPLLAFWTISFQFFARAHIVIAAGVLGVHLTRRMGGRWLLALVAVYLASFASEHLGTGYGLPFGDYRYTAMLGPKLGGRVPVVIPLSWFLMALPSFVMASVTFPGRAGRWGRIGFASLLLVVWDLALDPAMSFLVPYWIWGDVGLYYGMPWINLVGWFVTGLLIMGLLEVLGGRSWGTNLSARWCLAYWGVTVLMPLGMVAVTGHWLAVGVTLAGIAGCWGIHLWLRPHANDPQPNSASVLS